MAGRFKYDWPDDDDLVEQIKKAGTRHEWSKQTGIPERTLQSRLRARGLSERVREATKVEVPEVEAVLTQTAQDVHKVLKGRGSYTVEELADKVDVSPKKIREALVELRIQGYRVPDEKEQDRVILEKLAPEKLNLHESLLDGDKIRVGVVSDTHLSSKEEALEELELAYDTFAQEGITEVWHAGDWTCGMGVYRGQVSEVKEHTYEAQVDHLEAYYPRRKGIITRGISGNHDIEGEFGKVGANPVVALANRREDIEFLGDYTAWVELPNGSWVHLLHGKGGGAYAFSYQAQRYVESYPAGRKPAVLIVGHFHRKGNIEARGVEVVWPGCFEWKTPYMSRLGLTPAVGFHIFTMTLGPDGTLVRFEPTWFRFFEGRKQVGK
jgi:predicted phosphodiesterase/DNA-binding HxlR family transcriptional regulator